MDPSIHWKKDNKYEQGIYVHYNDVLITSCPMSYYGPYLIIYHRDYYILWSTSKNINSGKYEYYDGGARLTNQDLEFVNECAIVYHKGLKEQIILIATYQGAREYLGQN